MTDSTGTTTVGLVAVVRDSTLVVTGLDRQDHSFPFQQILLLEREHSNVLGTIGLVFLGLGMLNVVAHGGAGPGGSSY